MSPGPEADLSVVVACTRPHLIAGIARALADQASDHRCELVVAGDVADLHAVDWPLPTVLIPCHDPHPNRRRCEGIARTTAPILAFIDDDAIPQPGWLEAAATMDPEANEIWTGPELPTRSSPGAELAYAVSCALLAEGSRAHVDFHAREVRWSDAPFCNLVTTRRLVDRIGAPSVAVSWDLDDFEFCRRAHLAGTTFRNRPEMMIRHDRYPDRIRDWLVDKAGDRRRTGHKIVSNPEFYRGLPGTVVAVAGPPLALLAATAFAPAKRARRIIAFGLVGYLGIVGSAGWADTGSGQPGRVRRAISFASVMVMLHVVSIASVQAGVAEGLLERVGGRRKPSAPRRHLGMSGPTEPDNGDPQWPERS